MMHCKVGNEKPNYKVEMWWSTTSSLSGRSLFEVILKLECDRISSTVELISEGMLHDLKVEAQTNWTSLLCGFDLPKHGFGVTQHGNSREIFIGRRILCLRDL